MAKALESREETMNEKDVYMEYLNKFVRVSKRMGGKTYYYNGYINDVLEDKIVIEDRKIGQVVIAFDVIQSIEIVDDGSGSKYITTF